MTELLKSWLKSGPTKQQLISFNHHDFVTGAMFTDQVASLHSQLCQSSKQRWLLSCDRSDLFAAGLCAALLAGKEIILPANVQTGTLLDLEQTFDAILGDSPLDCDKPFLDLSKPLTSDDYHSLWPEVSNWGRLQLFTSGSSGNPKCVHKSVEQLDAEVSILEHTFARSLPQYSVISTVSHQHIYGLLFKILWPLAASRPFLSDLVEYPETLSYYANLFPKLCLVSSPAQLSRLPQSLDFERQLRSPSLVFSSGGPLSFAAASGIAQCYGQPPIEVFGSTETGGIAYRRQHSATQNWQAFDSIKIKQDEHDDALWLQSPYLENSDWLKCDDKITLFDNNQFQLNGRLDRIVKVEEKRLSLDQMEALLLSHPFVEQAALVILEQPRTQLAAVIELSTLGLAALKHDGKLAINNQLKSHLLSQFERVTLPKRWRYPEQMPSNSQGKRTQKQLIELFDHE